MSNIYISFTILNTRVEKQIEQFMRLAEMMLNLGDEDESTRLVYLAADAQVKLWEYQAALAA